MRDVGLAGSTVFYSWLHPLLASNLKKKAASFAYLVVRQQV